MEIKTSKGVNYVNADYTIEEKQGEYPKLTCTIPASKNKIWIDDCKELDRLYTPGEQDEFVIINPVKITKGDSYDLEITAVGAFEFDFVKSRIDDNLPTRSYTVEYLLDLVFKDTRYSYDLQGTYEKREFTNFGSDNRYKLFLQIMNRFNLEFKIIGKIVRINSKIGNDTGFQFRYLKNIKDTKYSVDATNLVTHVKGYGAYHDANDQSKGRLEVEYLSPLSDIYGKLSGEPVVDERMSISATLLEKCKQSVESSVAVTVSTTLVALKNQEYRGIARVGDSIWFIDERIELEKKIRFSTVKSYYDAFDELIKQDVQLGDKDVFSRAQSSDSASQSKLIDKQKELSDQLADVEDAIKKTYVMPSGVNRVFYSSDLPEDVPKGTIKEGDTLFRNIDGETKMYRWDGVQWELVPVVNDVEKFREELDNEIAQVNTTMQANESERQKQIDDLLLKAGANKSLAEEAKKIGDQAKLEAADALSKALQYKNEAIAEATRLDTVERQATETKLATARSQAVAEATQLINTAKTTLETQIGSANKSIADAKKSLETQISSVSTEITKTNDTIKTLATKTDIDATNRRVTSAETSLTQQAGQIALKANQSTVDTLSGRVNNAETSITQQASQIALKANASDVDTLTNRVSTTEASLRVQSNQIALKASQSEVDSVKSRLQNAESSLTVQAGEIASRVKTSDFDQAKKRISTAESSIIQLGNRITTEISEVSTKLDNFKVGSRNYAEDYDFSRGLWEYSQEDSSPRNINFTDGVYTLTTTTNSWHQLQIHSESGIRLGGKTDSTALLEPKVGEIYTLSVEVKVNSGSPKFWLELRDNGLANYNTVVTQLGGSGTAITATSEWVRYAVTGPLKPNSDFGHRRIILGYNGIGSISFRKVELTQSSNFTDAGPAPEDTLTEIENAKTTITQTASGVEQLSTKLTKTADKVTSAETNIRQLVNEVASKVSQTTFDNLKKTVDSQGTAITQNQSAIALKAEKIYVDGVKTTADSALSKANANADSIRTTRAELQITNEAIETKASKTDVNNLTGRMSDAETTIRTQAGLIEQRLTSTQVDATISSKGYQTASQVNTAITSKGYQTKSDVDSNITGRGYITNSALQPYALATTVQNLVKETADSFSRTISETKALIPTSVGGRNLIRGSSEMIIGSGRWQDGTFRKSGTGTIKTINISSPPVPNVTKGIEVEIASAAECGIAQDTLFLPKGTYTFTVWVKGPTGATGRIDTFNGSGSSSMIFRLTGGWDKVTVTNTSTVDETKSISYVYLSTSPGYPAKMHLTAPKLETGPIPTAWSPAPEDLATVTALHNVTDTVDSHTRTISTINGTVSTLVQTAAGLVTEVSGTNGLKTQVSTLAGSWAVQNLTSAGTVLNQLNLNRDGSVRIDGKLVQITGKTYIENGVIKEAMIGKGQIGTAHIGEIDAGIAKIINLDVSNIKGLDAEFIKAKIENAFIEWMKGKTITAQNEAMTIGLNDAFIRFKDNAKIEFQSENNTLYRTKNGTSAFIHFRDDSYNGVYTAMGVNADNTGTQNDYSSGSFAGVRVIRSNPSRYSGTVVDQVQLVGDEIRIRHGYGYENDYLVIKWDNQGKIDLIKFLRSVASKLGLPLT